MISFAPNIFREETIYSWLVRWALCLGLPTQKEAINHVLKKHRGSQLMSQFPSYLPQLAQTSKVPVSQLVYEHTALRYFRLFSDPKLYNQAVHALASGQCQNLVRKLSITANRIQDYDHLKYCPLCAIDDYNTVGTTYWHLQHQLSGVTACSAHRTMLIGCPKGRSKLILPPSPTIQSDVVPASEEAVYLSRLSSELLNAALPLAPLNSVINGYRQRLIEFDLAISESTIKQVELRNKLENYWQSLLGDQCISSIFALGAGQKYPACIFQGYATQRHPLKHLLLIGYLFSSVYECIDYCHQTKDIFIPSLRHTEKINTQSQTRRSGNLEQSVTALLLEGKSLRNTAKEVGVNLSLIKAISVRKGITIQRRAKKLFSEQRRSIWRKLLIGLPSKEISISLQCSEGAVQKELSCYPELIALRKRVRFYKKRSQHREKLADLKTEKPPLSRGLIQSKARASYTWLYKHDNEWLEKNLPPAIPRHKRPSKAKY